MLPHQERVVIEKKELDEKLTKLGLFIRNNGVFQTLLLDDQVLLKDQYETMGRYSLILEKRIERFNQ